MPHFSMSWLATRVLMVTAGLALLGIALKVIEAMLGGILPPALTQLLRSGWEHLYQIVAPSMGPIGALVILALLLFIFTRRE
jgi:hypothetical protein